MTIQEAIKSGRPFKRPHSSYYSLLDKNPSKGDSTITFWVSDILADDWEVREKEEEKIELTAKQVYDAYHQVNTDFWGLSDELINRVLILLGFKNV